MHLVTDCGLYDQKAFYEVKIVLVHPLKEIVWHNYIPPARSR